jgi:uncharacterized protein involved in exopolysaccharide biosynthesis
VESTTSVLTKQAEVAAAAPLASRSSPAAAPDQPEVKPRSAILQAQLDLIRLRYSDDHPDVKRLRAEIDRLKDLEQREEASRPTPAKPDDASQAKGAAPATRPIRERPELLQARERVTSLKAQIAQINRELEFRKGEQQRILRDMGTYQSRVSKLPVREQEMAQITRDYEISKANYRSLLDKMLSAEMATDMERRQKSERFTVLDPARTPEKPFKPNRPLFYGIGSLAGLVIGLAFGLGREIKEDVLLGEWELPPHLPILGRLPYIEISLTESAGQQPSGGKRFFGRKLRLAVVSSAVVSLLAVIVVGIYLVSHQF